MLWKNIAKEQGKKCKLRRRTKSEAPAKGLRASEATLAGVEELRGVLKDCGC